MKKQTLFSNKFLPTCVGISIVLVSMSLFMFSIKTSFANGSSEIPSKSFEPVYQVGTAENFIPLVLKGDHVYWLVYNTSAGYKFRKSPVAGSHWGSRTK